MKTKFGTVVNMISLCLCRKYEWRNLNESYPMAILKGNVKNSDVQLGILPPKMA